jgi:hypothetical protein
MDLENNISKINWIYFCGRNKISINFFVRFTCAGDWNGRVYQEWTDLFSVEVNSETLRSCNTM